MAEPVAGSAQVTDISHEAAAPAIPAEEVYTLSFKHAGKTHEITATSSDCLFDLKASIYSIIAVAPDRQKIVGLVKGKLPPDDLPLSSLDFSRQKSFMVIGTPENQEVRKALDSPDILSDWDLAISDALKHTPQLDQRNKRKIAEAAQKLEINVINPPRPGRKCLVLDIDYTLLDCKSWQDQAVATIDFIRPYLDEFLTAVYAAGWDLIIWSQTNWRWLETKLAEMNMVGADHDRYNVCCVLDKQPMFEVISYRSGKSVKHHVKALEIIWKKFPDVYTPANTLHVDDLGRNFVLNPKNGIKIRAFKNKDRHDRELKLLQHYLVKNSTVEDVRTLPNESWREVAKAESEGKR